MISLSAARAPGSFANFKSDGWALERRDWNDSPANIAAAQQAAETAYLAEIDAEGGTREKAFQKYFEKYGEKLGSTLTMRWLDNTAKVVQAVAETAYLAKIEAGERAKRPWRPGSRLRDAERAKGKHMQADASLTGVKEGKSELDRSIEMHLLVRSGVSSPEAVANKDKSLLVSAYYIANNSTLVALAKNAQSEVYSDRLNIIAFNIEAIMQAKLAEKGLDPASSKLEALAQARNEAVLEVNAWLFADFKEIIAGQFGEERKESAGKVLGGLAFAGLTQIIGIATTFSLTMVKEENAKGKDNLDNLYFSAYQQSIVNGNGDVTGDMKLLTMPLGNGTINLITQKTDNGVGITEHINRQSIKHSEDSQNADNFLFRGLMVNGEYGGGISGEARRIRNWSR